MKQKLKSIHLDLSMDKLEVRDRIIKNGYVVNNDKNKMIVDFEYNKLVMWSDLHLDYSYTSKKILYQISKRREWHTFKYEQEKEDQTILLLGGDTVNGNNIELLPLFIREMLNKFGMIVMILGNHEYYYENMDYINYFVKNMNIENFYVLIDESIEIHRKSTNEKLVIYGSTLWSDISEHKDDERIKKVFNKPKHKGCEYELNIEKYIKLYEKSSHRLIDFVSNFKYETSTKLIIMTHYGLSSLFITEKYKDFEKNCMYTSDLDKIFIYPIYMVMCGHVHESQKFKVKDVVCVANPRGYEDEISNFKVNNYIYL